MTDKDKKFISYWEGVINRGRLYYTMVHGIIFGTIIFLIIFVFSYFDNSLTKMFAGYNFFLTLLLYIVGGMIYEGIFSWFLNSKKYKNLTGKS